LSTVHYPLTSRKAINNWQRTIDNGQLNTKSPLNFWEGFLVAMK